MIKVHEAGLYNLSEENKVTILKREERLQLLSIEGDFYLCACSRGKVLVHKSGASRL